MKTKLFAILFCIIPTLIFSQNYEKQGDELFKEAKYADALKKYNAAIELSGEGESLLKKQENARTCQKTLEQAYKAETEGRFGEASQLYKKLFNLHALEEYNSKSLSLSAKAEQKAKENVNNIKSGKVAPDGSLVLKLYYNRAYFDVEWLNHKDEVIVIEDSVHGIKAAKDAGKTFIILKSGDIHKELNLKSRMPQVCNAMRQSMNEGDIVLHTTPSGNSSTIEIQYNV